MLFSKHSNAASKQACYWTDRWLALEGKLADHLTDFRCLSSGELLGPRESLLKSPSPAGSAWIMFMRDVRRSGRWFPERGCILKHQICRFAKMILRDRCSTSYDLASIFRGRRSTLDRWSAKIAKRIGTRPSALHSTFHVWRKSSRLASFFDVVNFENWGSLADLFRFWCCQSPKMKKSRRIVSFWTLLCAKIKEISQNFFVFDLADR